MHIIQAVSPDPGLGKIFSRCDREHPLIRELEKAVHSFKAREDPLDRDRPVKPPASQQGPSTPADETFPLGQPQPLSDLTSLIKMDLNLSSPPEIFIQIERVINDPRSSARQVAHIVSQDPGLSARLLKIVNSVFFGFPQQIDTISRAVTILGTGELSALALGTSVMALFREIPPALMNMGLFWKHSLACGVCARLLAGFKNFPGLERFFIAGLLHDVGKLILFKHLPQISDAILRSIPNSDLLYHEAERLHLGFDHGRVGLLLAEQWKLPPTLEQGLGRHHQPLHFPPSAEAALVSLADAVVNALGFGNSGERRVSPEVIEICDFLCLPPGLIESLVPLISRQVEETFHLFYPIGHQGESS